MRLDIYDGTDLEQCEGGVDPALESYSGGGVAPEPESYSGGGVAPALESYSEAKEMFHYI